MNSVVTIHGFLGSPGDFAALDFAGNRLDIDLFNRHALRPEESKLEWLERISQLITALPSPRIFIGYSLGGRIALELLNLIPDICSSIVLLAAHPGLRTDEERGARLQSDSVWADKLLKLEESTILKEWNSQPVFRGSQPLQKLPDAPREVLAQTLRTFSLAVQPDFHDLLLNRACHAGYLCGEHDSRFRKIALDFKDRVPTLTIDVIDNAGHRLLADRPDVVVARIHRMITAECEEGP